MLEVYYRHLIKEINDIGKIVFIFLCQYRDCKFVKLDN